MFASRFRTRREFGRRSKSLTCAGRGRRRSRRGRRRGLRSLQTTPRFQIETMSRVAVMSRRRIAVDQQQVGAKAGRDAAAVAQA